MGEWRFASIKLGIQFVMSTGIMLMQVLYVVSWDSLQMVSLQFGSILILFNNVYQLILAIHNGYWFQVLLPLEEYLQKECGP